MGFFDEELTKPKIEIPKPKLVSGINTDPKFWNELVREFKFDFKTTIGVTGHTVFTGEEKEQIISLRTRIGIGYTSRSKGEANRKYGSWNWFVDETHEGLAVVRTIAHHLVGAFERTHRELGRYGVFDRNMQFGRARWQLFLRHLGDR